jgi:hypothetical protein
MKILCALTIAAVNVWAGERTPVAEHNVIVCVAEWGPDFTLLRAKSIAGGMFAAVGVRVEWHNGRSCPAMAIVISFSDRTNVKFLPVALAYALPYEGTHIVVFADRVQSVMPGRYWVPNVLAHVMVHEITHILQGLAQHSNTGVMKAHWTMSDFSAMAFKPLPFTQADVELIHEGMGRRELRMAAAH